MLAYCTRCLNILTTSSPWNFDSNLSSKPHWVESQIVLVHCRAKNFILSFCWRCMSCLDFGPRMESFTWESRRQPVCDTHAALWCYAPEVDESSAVLCTMSCGDCVRHLATEWVLLGAWHSMWITPSDWPSDCSHVVGTICFFFGILTQLSQRWYWERSQVWSL